MIWGYHYFWKHPYIYIISWSSLVKILRFVNLQLHSYFEWRFSSFGDVTTSCEGTLTPGTLFRTVWMWLLDITFLIHFSKTSQAPPEKKTGHCFVQHYVHIWLVITTKNRSLQHTSTIPTPQNSLEVRWGSSTFGQSGEPGVVGDMFSNGIS